MANQQNHTQQDATKAIKGGYQAAADQGEHLLDQAGKMGKEYMEQFKEVSSDVTDRISKTSKQVSAWTRENPMQAVLIGAGLGFLFGAVARRALRTKK